MIPLPDDIQLRFEDRPGYLHASVSGPRDSQQISLTYWAHIAEEVRRRRAGRLLVEENLGDHEGDRDLPGLVEAVVAMGLDRVQVAFDVNRVDLLAQMEYGEILAMEQGANGRVFASVATAEQWLRHGGG